MISSSSFVSYFPLSVRYMILSALGFAMMGVFVKIAYSHGIPVLEIVAARALVSGVISYIDVKRKGISLWGNKKILLFSRGLAGAIALVAVYTALVNLPFAEATVLQYLHPMFTAVLAVIFLKERLRFPTILCIVLSFIGLILIVRPDILFGVMSANYPLWAVMAAILGAFGSAVAYVLVRQLNRTEDTSVIIFYFPLIALPLSLLLLGDDMVMPTGWTWLVLLLVGVFTQIGQIGLTKAMQTEGAAKATSFSYLQVVFAIVLGIFFFSEWPSVWTFVGSACILGAAVMNVVLSRKDKTSD